VACYYPVKAWRTLSGEIVFAERGDIVDCLALPCGGCVGCRLERSRQWSIRVMHEASRFERNCFVTLTYADDFLPPGGSLRYRDFQLFLKRLRKRFSPVRFYMCGEYGGELGRPHFHAALFNVDFSEDRYQWSVRGGFPVYRSPALEKCWSMGSSEIGSLTRESAAYIARYVMKKVTGPMASEYYKVVDQSTGEVFWKEPEFTRMSLRPGIGADWFARFESDVFPHDRCVVGGVPCKPPRYYDQLLARRDPDALQAVVEARVGRARERWKDNVPERLAVKEQVASARLNLYRRKLK
jgi:hypothetical protein